MERRKGGRDIGNIEKEGKVGDTKVDSWEL